MLQWSEQLSEQGQSGLSVNSGTSTGWLADVARRTARIVRNVRPLGCRTRPLDEAGTYERCATEPTANPQELLFATTADPMLTLVGNVGLVHMQALLA